MFRFGLLFSGFRPRLWWYEIVMYLRKVAVILVVTFASDSAQQLHIALGTLVALLFLQEHMRPFDDPHATPSRRATNDRLHRMESFSLMVSVTMVWSAVFFVLGCESDLEIEEGGAGGAGGADEHAGGGGGREALCSVLGVTVLGVNFIFVVLCAAVFARAWMVAQKIGQGDGRMSAALASVYHGLRSSLVGDRRDAEGRAADAATVASAARRGFSSPGEEEEGKKQEGDSYVNPMREFQGAVPTAEVELTTLEVVEEEPQDLPQRLLPQHTRHGTQLPDGWAAIVIPEDGRKYYAHQESGRSSWIPPPGSTKNGVAWEDAAGGL